MVINRVQFRISHQYWVGHSLNSLGSAISKAARWSCCIVAYWRPSFSHGYRFLFCRRSPLRLAALARFHFSATSKFRPDFLRPYRFSSLQSCSYTRVFVRQPAVSWNGELCCPKTCLAFRRRSSLPTRFAIRSSLNLPCWLPLTRWDYGFGMDEAD